MVYTYMLHTSRPNTSVLKSFSLFKVFKLAALHKAQIFPDMLGASKNALVSTILIHDWQM